MVAAPGFVGAYSRDKDKNATGFVLAARGAHNPTKQSC
jgi:hypothetical protein